MDDNEARIRELLHAGSGRTLYVFSIAIDDSNDWQFLAHLNVLSEHAEVLSDPCQRSNPSTVAR